MNVWTAIIGLAGVLGGATIGALAAIYGPQRLHKRQTDVKAAEAQTLRNEAAVQRLVALRTTGRSWLEALEQVAGDIDAGRAITLDQFDAVVGPLRSESSRTSDDLALIGRALPDVPGWGDRIPSTPNPPVRREVLGADGLAAYSEVMGKLCSASDAVRRDLRRVTLGRSTGISKETWQFLEAARRARAAFTGTLLAQIETLTAPTCHPSSARVRPGPPPPTVWVPSAPPQPGP